MWAIHVLQIRHNKKGKHTKHRLHLFLFRFHLKLMMQAYLFLARFFVDRKLIAGWLDIWAPLTMIEHCICQLIIETHRDAVSCVLTMWQGCLGPGAVTLSVPCLVSATTCYNSTLMSNRILREGESQESRDFPRFKDTPVTKESFVPASNPLKNSSLMGQQKQHKIFWAFLNPFTSLFPHQYFRDRITTLDILHLGCPNVCIDYLRCDMTQPWPYRHSWPPIGSRTVLFRILSIDWG